jgi:DNA topoisomerase I
MKRFRFRDIHIWFDEATFKESEHPRDPEGQFTAGSGGKKSATKHLLPAAGTGKEKTTMSGQTLPTHILDLKVPPAWTDVKYSPDPDAPLLAMGKDAKGRPQYIYSAKFISEQTAAKFARIKELNEKFDQIRAENEKARKSTDPKVRDEADCAALIMSMGIRPGSETDTKAKAKGYGATTLEGRHVVVAADGVRLQFVPGKKHGETINLLVSDKKIAQMLRDRKNRVGDNGKLFGISEKDLLDHVHGYDGGGFKTKDFRTLLGTRTAMAEVEKLPKPNDEKDYKKAVMNVAKVVSSKLGNTPTIALQSYIAPEVFAPWRMGNESVTA